MAEEPKKRKVEQVLKTTDAGPDETPVQQAKKISKVDMASLKYEQASKKISKQIDEYNDVSIIEREDMSCKLLVMITNNVRKSRDMNRQKGLSHVNVNFVVLRVISGGGLRAPYEPKPNDKQKTQINPKHRIYTDKEGKSLEAYTPAALCSIKSGDKGQYAVVRSYETHPNNALKTTCRGVSTDVVGALYPGIPMSCCVFDDNVTIMEDEATENKLCEFALAIISVRVRSMDQCQRGYGLNVRGISLFTQQKAYNSRLYEMGEFYNDRKSIKEQTKDLKSMKRYSNREDGDISFIQKLVGSDDDNVYEKPLVFLSSNATKTCVLSLQKKVVHIQDVSAVEEGSVVQPIVGVHEEFIQLSVTDQTSVYSGMKMKIFMQKGIFYMPETSKEWVNTYYQWCLNSGLASVAIIHNDYVFGKCLQDSTYMMSACVTLDEARLLQPSTKDIDLEFTTKMIESLSDVLDVREKKVDGSQRYSAWKVSESKDTGETFYCILDLREKYVATTNGTLNDDIRADQQSSPIVFVPSMRQGESCWIMYLCTLQDGAFIFKLPVGVNTSTGALQGGDDHMADIFANPWAK